MFELFINRSEIKWNINANFNKITILNDIEYKDDSRSKNVFNSKNG